jgi:hypothetical protein
MLVSLDRTSATSIECWAESCSTVPRRPSCGHSVTYHIDLVEEREVSETAKLR